MRDRWDFAIFVSRQEQKLLTGNARWTKRLAAFGIKKAAPYVFSASGLPPEFSDWEGKSIDLRIDPDAMGKASMESMIMALQSKGALAIKKSGKWFAIKLLDYNEAGGTADSIHAKEITEDEAKSMLHFPEDWENKVVVA